MNCNGVADNVVDLSVKILIHLQDLHLHNSLYQMKRVIINCDYYLANLYDLILTISLCSNRTLD